MKLKRNYGINTDRNIIIEGDSLEALRNLQWMSKGKVDVMLAAPPCEGDWEKDFEERLAAARPLLSPAGSRSSRGSWPPGPPPSVFR